MTGFLTRWMIARSLEERVTAPSEWGHSRDGGRYAQELRNVARRLRHEAPMDEEEPSRELRERTLDAIHEAYLFPRHPMPQLPRAEWPVSARAITRLAACLFLLVGGFIAAEHFGPSVWQRLQSMQQTARSNTEASLPSGPALATDARNADNESGGLGTGKSDRSLPGSEFRQVTMDPTGRDSHPVPPNQLVAERTPATPPKGDQFP